MHIFTEPVTLCVIIDIRTLCDIVALNEYIVFCVDY